MTMPRGVLLERSFSAADIPKTFYVVGRLDAKALGDLQNRTLEGVTGISDDRGIVRQFLGSQGRGFVLTMPGPATAKLNKLSRIMYDNPFYLAQDNMKAAARLIGYKGPDGGSSVARSLGDTAAGRMGTPWHGDEILIYDGMARRHIAPFDRPRIRDLHDLAERWRAVYRMFGVKRELPHYVDLSRKPHKYWVGWVSAGLKVKFGNFAREGEWIIKDRKLRVPKDAHLWIATFDPNNAKNAKWLVDVGGWDSDAISVASEDAIKAGVK